MVAADAIESLTPERVFFDAWLRPNASLSPRGFKRVMIAFSLFALSLGLLFFSIGAWPIVGFLGLDILLVYGLLKLNYRRAHRYERLRLTESGLTVERVKPGAAREKLDIEPTWLQINMDDPPEHESQLILRSHGKEIKVGAFLTPEERLEVAQALRTALAAWRAPPDYPSNPPLAEHPA